MKKEVQVMNQTIWIINQYASHLKTRHESLAKVFSEHGFQVVVITSSFHHGQRAYLYHEPIAYHAVCDGVTYVYLHSGPSYQNNGAGRIINMLDFCRLVWKYKGDIERRTGMPGYVIASSAPPFVWEAGRAVARKFHAKFIAEFRDIWPLSLVDVQGMHPRHPLVWLLGIIEKRAYRHADAIVSTMPDAWKHVVEVSGVQREKVHWMPNGINVRENDAWLDSAERLPADLEDYLSSHWCCIYIGSIVKSERLDYLVETIGQMENEGVYFAIVGQGHEQGNIQKLIDQSGHKNIRMFPFIERSLIQKALRRSRCCVAACKKDAKAGQFGLSMYKLNDYLYSGVPTIFAYDLPSVVSQAGHFTVPYGDKEAFVQAVRQVREADDRALAVLAENARHMIHEQYDYASIGEKYLKMLTSC